MDTRLKPLILGKKEGEVPEASPSWSPSLIKPERFCSLHNAIGRFYWLELHRHQTRQRWHGILPERYERYFAREFSDRTETLLKFVLAAGLGEARHALRNYQRGNDIYRASAKGKAALEAIDQLESIVGKVPYEGSSVPFWGCERTSVYRLAIHPRDWQSLFAILFQLFTKGYWSGSFGGVTWGSAMGIAYNLHRVWRLDDTDQIVFYFDRLVNWCHNGGLLLDKFDCVAGFHDMNSLLGGHSSQVGHLYLAALNKFGRACTVACGRTIWSNHEKVQEIKEGVQGPQAEEWQRTDEMLGVAESEESDSDDEDGDEDGDSDDDSDDGDGDDSL